VVSAPIRSANCRLAPERMGWSPSATRDQDGNYFQAGVPIPSKYYGHDVSMCP
jgi:hypothetical protein